MASYRAVACDEGEILGCTMSSAHAHTPGPKLKMRLFDLAPKSTSISAITLSPTPDQWAAGAVIGSIGTRVRVYSKYINNTRKIPSDVKYLHMSQNVNRMQ